MSNSRTVLLVTSLLVILLISIFSSAMAQTSTRQRCEAEVCHVEITNEGFMPKTLFVPIGSTVIWTNKDDGAHTVTSGSPGAIVAPFRSFLLKQGESYEFAFEYSGLYRGSYKYFDQVSRTMRGEIVVEPEVVKVDEEEPEVWLWPIDVNDPAQGIKKISFPTGTVKSIDADSQAKRLIINLENVSIGGKLQITLDRMLIDSQVEGKDQKFIVLVDDNEGFLEEIASTSRERTLQIVVPAKAEEVQIIGTNVTPEFPYAVVVIMAVILFVTLVIGRFMGPMKSFFILTK